MAIVCSLKHKKPVCNQCNADTNCNKCCPCQPQTKGHPRKMDESETLHWVNPEREARVHPERGTDASLGMVVEDYSGPSTHMHGHTSSQAHIIEILECMGCEKVAYTGSESLMSMLGSE